MQKSIIKKSSENGNFTNTNDEGGLDQVLKDFAWNTFEFTGSIDSYFFFKEIEERNKGAEQKEIAEEEAAISTL